MAAAGVGRNSFQHPQSSSGLRRLQVWSEGHHLVGLQVRSEWHQGVGGFFSPGSSLSPLTSHPTLCSPRSDCESSRTVRSVSGP